MERRFPGQLPHERIPNWVPWASVLPCPWNRGAGLRSDKPRASGVPLPMAPIQQVRATAGAGLSGMKGERGFSGHPNLSPDRRRRLHPARVSVLSAHPRRRHPRADVPPPGRRFRQFRRRPVRGGRRLRDFLIQRFGGPEDYSRRRGHPRLRMRHFPFAIDERARNRWVQLMGQALAEMRLPPEAEQILRRFFHESATFLINRPN